MLKPIGLTIDGSRLTIENNFVDLNYCLTLKIICMFIELSHTKLDVYFLSKKLNVEIHRILKKFPADEKFNSVQQIKRAALSVHLNIAEGSSRKSLTERKRFFEISRGSLIEIDAAFDVAVELAHCYKSDLNLAGEYILRIFQMLSAMIKREPGIGNPGV